MKLHITDAEATVKKSTDPLVCIITFTYFYRFAEIFIVSIQILGPFPRSTYAVQVRPWNAVGNKC